MRSRRAVVGAYYGKLLARAADEGRITGVPYDPAAPVFTAWDLGMDDSTAIWVAQCVGREIHLIDYYEANGQPLAHYADWVRGRGYGQADALPAARRPGAGTRHGQEPGRRCSPGWTSALCSSSPSRAWPTASTRCAPSCRVAGSTRSNAGPVRKPCSNYRKEYDEKRKVFHDRPLHDWTSHAADAFRYLALSCGQHQKSGSEGFRPRRR